MLNHTSPVPSQCAAAQRAGYRCSLALLAVAVGAAAAACDDPIGESCNTICSRLTTCAEFDPDSHQVPSDNCARRCARELEEGRRCNTRITELAACIEAETCENLAAVRSARSTQAVPCLEQLGMIGGACGGLPPVLGNEPTVRPVSFQCADGQAIPFIWHCDGADDCSDGTDETGCTAECPARTTFECATAGAQSNADYACMPRERLCDATADCLDASDEPPTCLAAG